MYKRLISVFLFFTLFLGNLNSIFSESKREAYDFLRKSTRLMGKAYQPSKKSRINRKRYARARKLHNSGIRYFNRRRYRNSIWYFKRAIREFKKIIGTSEAGTAGGPSMRPGNLDRIPGLRSIGVVASGKDRNRDGRLDGLAIGIVFYNKRYKSRRKRSIRFRNKRYKVKIRIYTRKRRRGSMKFRKGRLLYSGIRYGRKSTDFSALIIKRKNFIPYRKIKRVNPRITAQSGYVVATVYTRNGKFKNKTFLAAPIYPGVRRNGKINGLSKISVNGYVYKRKRQLRIKITFKNKTNNVIYFKRSPYKIYFRIYLKNKVIYKGRGKLLKSTDKLKIPLRRLRRARGKKVVIKVKVYTKNGVFRGTDRYTKIRI